MLTIAHNGVQTGYVTDFNVNLQSLKTISMRLA